VGNLQQENSAIVRAVLDLETLTWDSTERELYDGPWALCDRAAQAEGRNAANTAAQVGASESGQAQSDRAALTPFYRSEMTAQHGFNPGQTEELLNYAGAGTGGAGATSMGQAQSEAARTRNTSGFTGALDQSARDRTRAMGDINAGVGAQDVLGAKQLNQEGAAGEAGLYGTDTAAMLSAMGQVPADINAQMAAQQHGWVQDLSNGLAIGQQGMNLVNSYMTKQQGSTNATMN